jgi:hypothetical protein
LYRFAITYEASSLVQMNDISLFNSKRKVAR